MNIFSRRRNDVAVILDIGNGSIGGGIALLGETRPALLYETRVNIPFQAEVRGHRLLSLMIQTVSQTVQRLLREGFDSAGFGAPPPRVSETFVTLSAPWVITNTFFLRLSNKEPILITEEVLLRLIREREKEKSVSKGRIQIEQKLMRVELNGYETARPFGKKASEASFAMLSGVSPETVVRQITEVISHEAHSPLVSFHSFAFVASAALRELFPELASFLHIDASSEQTEVSIVKRGVLIQTVSFPYGRNHFIREILRSTRASGSAAETLFTEVGEQKGAGVLYARARRAFQKSGEDWLARFLSVLSSFSESLFMPRDIFVTADPDMYAALNAAIAGADRSKFSPASFPFQILCVSSDSLQQFLQYNPKSQPDPFLCLETIACFALRRGGGKEL